MTKRILTIIGTRPEAIKLCPLVQELQSRPEAFESVVCSTGQHKEMLQQVFDTFNVTADFDLALMAPNQSLAQVTARAVKGLDEVFEKVKPNACIVQGDTSTAFCGALVGHYHKTLIGHVEAGLRTGNKFSPFPEEMNRRLVGRMADFHFAPTPQSRDALLNEDTDPNTVFVTGNTVIDALFWVQKKVTQEIPAAAREVANLLGENQVVLVTGHRRESFGGGFENMCQAIRESADTHHDWHFVYPVHLNPNVQEPVNRLLADHPRIHLIAPLSYEPFVWLMDRSTVVLTDSGGVQEEAPSLGKPVLVMRETTEREEGITAGNAKLVGTSKEKITSELSKLLTNPAAREAMASVQNPYGSGDAARQIVDILADRLG